MRLKNILIVVKDIEKSKAFYKDLFGLQVIADFGENVILSEGLVLQERKIWEKAIGESIIVNGKDMELYFEDYDLDEFVKKIENSDFEISYLNPLTEQLQGQRMLRIYDPDKHIIEIREMAVGEET